MSRPASASTAEVGASEADTNSSDNGHSDRLRAEPAEVRAARLSGLLREAVARIRHVAACDGIEYDHDPETGAFPVCPCEGCARLDEFADYLENMLQSSVSEQDADDIPF